MKKQYDDFTKLKLKDMSKSISDMTYKYINPETNEPTSVPAQHYEKILDQVQEQYMGEITSRKFLDIMYSQLSALKKEDEKYFNQALLCIDMGLNPKDLRIDEQIAISYTYDFIENKKKVEKKEFHLLNQDIVSAYEESKNDPNIQTAAVSYSNMIEDKEYKETYSNDNKTKNEIAEIINDAVVLTKTKYITCDNNVIQIKGGYYESVNEFFDKSISIKLNNELLYYGYIVTGTNEESYIDGKYKNKENAIEVISNLINDKDYKILDNNPNKDYER